MLSCSGSGPWPGSTDRSCKKIFCSVMLCSSLFTLGTAAVAAALCSFLLTDKTVCVSYYKIILFFLVNDFRKPHCLNKVVRIVLVKEICYINRSDRGGIKMGKYISYIREKKLAKVTLALLCAVLLLGIYFLECVSVLTGQNFRSCTDRLYCCHHHPVDHTL